MQKTKFNFSGLLSIIKCVLIGIIATLIGIVIFSVVLKFADLSSIIISYVNDIIKAFSIFIMVMCIKKKGEGKLLIRAVIAGTIYAILSFVVFSILNGGFVFDLSFVYDLIFAIIVSAIVSVIINILNRKNA
ncbi:MAG: TIGR04086 family membrane protein [Clostridia bacterium]|nr:TIGR04086 family membrane protein [Clostridia bacterium]